MRMRNAAWQSGDHLNIRYRFDSDLASKETGKAAKRRRKKIHKPALREFKNIRRHAIQVSASGWPAFRNKQTTISGIHATIVNHQPNSVRADANQANGSSQKRLIASTASVTGR